jgi:hypothetical protein
LAEPFSGLAIPQIRKPVSALARASSGSRSARSSTAASRAARSERSLEIADLRGEDLVDRGGGFAHSLPPCLIGMEQECATVRF